MPPKKSSLCKCIQLHHWHFIYPCGEGLGYKAQNSWGETLKPKWADERTCQVVLSAYPQPGLLLLKLLFWPLPVWIYCTHTSGRHVLVEASLTCRPTSGLPALHAHSFSAVCLRRTSDAVTHDTVPSHRCTFQRAGTCLLLIPTAQCQAHSRHMRIC